MCVWGGMVRHSFRDRVLALQDKRVLEMDGGDGCAAMCMRLPPLNCHLDMVKMVHFMSCAFYYN